MRCGVCLALFDSKPATPAPPAESAQTDVDDGNDPSPASPSPDGEQRGWRRIALLWVGVTVAGAALVFQVFAYQFDRWALDPELRFIYEFACGVIDCELPDPSSQDTTSLDRGESLR